MSAAEPVILIFHREPAVARDLARSLRARFAANGFEVEQAASQMEAYAVVDRLARDNSPLALLVTDQDLGADRDLGITGVSLIASMRETHPQARAVLLIDHAEMDTAKQALTDGILDDFLVKPLRDHDDQLLPLVADMLDDWQRAAEAAEHAVQIVGDPSSPESAELRTFLNRNDVSSRFLTPANPKAQELLAGAGHSLPIVVLQDGTKLERPTMLGLADALEIQTKPKSDSYDLAIIGAGPAGLAAAVYGASEGLATVLLESFAPGGQAGQSSRIENYLGFPGGLSGSQLAQRALRQAHRFEAEIVRPREVVGFDLEEGRCSQLRLAGGTALTCRTALISCGVDYRRLEVDGIAELTGRGVNYGAGATDAKALESQRVIVVGGANSAGQAALHFAEHAARVTLVVRASELTKGMSHYLCERISAHHAIDVRTSTQVARAVGDRQLEGVELSTGEGDSETVDTDAMFIFIGAVPRTEWLPQSLRRDERGFILSGREAREAAQDEPRWSLERDPYPLETSVPGIFVAGDVRHGSIKRVASAVGEGSMAVQLVHQYLGDD